MKYKVLSTEAKDVVWLAWGKKKVKNLAKGTKKTYYMPDDVSVEVSKIGAGSVTVRRTALNGWFFCTITPYLDTTMTKAWTGEQSDPVFNIKTISPTTFHADFTNTYNIFGEPSYNLYPGTSNGAIFFYNGPLGIGTHIDTIDNGVTTRVYNNDVSGYGGATMWAYAYGSVALYAPTGPPNTTSHMQTVAFVPNGMNDGLLGSWPYNMQPELTAALGPISDEVWQTNKDRYIAASRTDVRYKPSRVITSDSRVLCTVPFTKANSYTGPSRGLSDLGTGNVTTGSYPGWNRLVTIHYLNGENYPRTTVTTFPIAINDVDVTGNTWNLLSWYVAPTGIYSRAVQVPSINVVVAKTSTINRVVESRYVLTDYNALPTYSETFVLVGGFERAWSADYTSYTDTFSKYANTIETHWDGGSTGPKNVKLSPAPPARITDVTVVDVVTSDSDSFMVERTATIKGKRYVGTLTARWVPAASTYQLITEYSSFYNETENAFMNTTTPEGLDYAGVVASKQFYNEEYVKLLDKAIINYRNRVVEAVPAEAGRVQPEAEAYFYIWWEDRQSLRDAIRANRLMRSNHYIGEMMGLTLPAIVDSAIRRSYPTLQSRRASPLTRTAYTQSFSTVTTNVYTPISGINYNTSYTTSVTNVSMTFEYTAPDGTTVVSDITGIRTIVTQIHQAPLVNGQMDTTTSTTITYQNWPRWFESSWAYPSNAYDDYLTEYLKTHVRGVPFRDDLDTPYGFLLEGVFTFCSVSPGANLFAPTETPTRKCTSGWVPALPATSNIDGMTVNSIAIFDAYDKDVPILHDYDQNKFCTTHPENGEIFTVIPLSYMLGGEELGMFPHDSDYPYLTGVLARGYLNVRFDSATYSFVPVEWVDATPTIQPLTWSTTAPIIVKMSRFKDPLMVKAWQISRKASSPALVLQVGKVVAPLVGTSY